MNQKYTIPANAGMIVSNNTIAGLDLMRFGAVLLVVFGHLMLYRPSSTFLGGQLGPLAGFLGMEMLLVLSGFWTGKKLCTMFTSNEAVSLKNVLNYLNRRAWRVLPLYYLVLFLVFLISRVLGYSVMGSWKYLIFIQNLCAPMPSFFPESWGIAVGFFGSLSLVGGLYVVARRFPLISRMVLAFWYSVVMILLVVGFRVYFYYHMEHCTIDLWDRGLKSVVLYRLDSFYIGVLAALWQVRFPGGWLRLRKWCFVAGALMMALQYVGLGYFGWLIGSRPFLWEVLYLPFASLAIVFTLPVLYVTDPGKPLLRLLTSRGARLSYGLFLIHYSVLMPVMHRFLDLSGYHWTDFFVFSVAYVVVALLIAFVLYRFYELPLFRWGTKN